MSYPAAIHEGNRMAPPAPLGQLQHYLIRAQSLYDRDRTLAARFASATDEKYLKFVDTEAVIYFRELQEVGVPFPPWTEMVTVGGETDIRKFLAIGFECFETIFRWIPSAKTRRRILDFGVGCGRTMRFFFRHQHDFECHGCDVDAKSIDYLTRNVPFIDARVSGTRPPLSYPTGFFDVVYCVSVFTHFNAEYFSSWMTEIARILRPGAVFIFSLHGRTAFDKVCASVDQRKLLGIDEREFQDRRSHYQRNGFAWLSQPVGSADIDTNSYGITFVDDERVGELLPTGTQLLEYSKGALSGWQDLVAIRKVA